MQQCIQAACIIAGCTCQPATGKGQLTLCPFVQDCKDIPAVQAMLATAQRVLGYDLLKVCMEGPKEKLDDTAFAQPALYVAGLAAVERLRVQVGALSHLDATAAHHHQLMVPAASTSALHFNTEVA